MVANSLCSFVTQLPMVIAFKFFLPSPTVKFPSKALGGIVFLVGVPSFPFG
jgi:hypothetical protein